MKARIDNLRRNLIIAIDETSRLETQNIASLDSLKNILNKYGSKERADSVIRIEVVRLENKIHDMTLTFSNWKESRTEHINKLQVDLKDLKGMLIQLPIVLLLTIIWISLFGGIVLAFILAYLGNVYFELYSLNEDGKPTYCRQIISEQNQRNHNQPLLGFTLLLILIIILICLFSLKEGEWNSFVR